MQYNNQLQVFIDRHKRKILFSFIGILLITTSWLVYFFLISFSITSIEPALGKIHLSQPTIEIHFTKDIANEGIDIDVSPDGIVSSVVAKDKSIIINLHENLRENQEYTVTLKSIPSTSGAIFSDYSFTFIPVNDPSLLSQKARDILLHRQNQKPAILNDDALNKLPLSGDTYNIKAFLDAAPNNQGVVRIETTIYLDRQLVAEYGGYREAINAIKKISDQALKDAKIDTTKYEISYKIQGP